MGKSSQKICRNEIRNMQLMKSESYTQCEFKTLPSMRLSSTVFSFWFSTLDKHCTTKTVLSCEVVGIQDGPRNPVQAKLSWFLSAKPVAKSLSSQPVACCQPRRPQLALGMINIGTLKKFPLFQLQLFYLHHPLRQVSPLLGLGRFSSLYYFK